MRDYGFMHTELVNRQTELRHRLQRIKRDITQSHSKGSSDQAQERENDEVLVLLRHEAEREFREIGTALIRLQKENYGCCLHCGSPILMPRLKIKPETPFCTTCAEHE